MSTNKIVGKCSNCGGAVTVPTIFYSTVPPIPTCQRCGSEADQTADVPVIKMIPNKRKIPVLRDNFPHLIDFFESIKGNNDLYKSYIYGSWDIVAEDNVDE